jgi:hypothetical protein
MIDLLLRINTRLGVFDLNSDRGRCGFFYALGIAVGIAVGTFIVSPFLICMFILQSRSP